MLPTSRAFGDPAQKSVLDHVEQLTFDPERNNKPGQDPRAIAHRLMYGLETCYRAVETQERKLPAGVNGASTGAGLYGTDSLLIHNCFDWYAINVCRLFSHIAYFSDQFSGFEHSERLQKVREYRTAVCGNVQAYRNKVAAHFAEVEPLKADNLADQLTSTLMSIQYTKGRIRLPVLQVHLRVGSSMHSPTSDIAWTLTEFHEQTVRRRIHGDGAQSRSGPR